MVSRDEMKYDPVIHGSKLVDGHDIDLVIDLLVMDNTVGELRDMASRLNVSRNRGDNKRQTAGQIAHQADHLLRVDEGPRGELTVRAVDPQW